MAEHVIDLTSPFLSHTSSSPTCPYSFIVLNQPINEKAYDALSPHASYITCADAGADRLLALTASRTGTARRLPDAVIGDLDSVQRSTLDHYREHGVQIIYDGDQYSTDFTKSLKHIRRLAEGLGNGGDSGVDGARMDIMTFGGLGGRVDQAFSIVHHLFAALRHPDWLRGNIYLIGRESLSVILEKGRTRIRCGSRAPVEERLFDENVGIIPVMGKTIITTKGLEWDVEDWETEIGGQVSTSNHLKMEEIEIETSERVLFTLEFAGRFSAKASA